MAGNRTAGYRAAGDKAAGDGPAAGRLAVDGVDGDSRSGFSVELRSRTRDRHERLEHLLDLPWRLGGPSDLADVLGIWGGLWAGVRSGCGAAAGRDESARLLVSAVRAVRQVAVDLEDLAAVAATREQAGRGAQVRRVAALRAAPDRCCVPALGSPAGVWAVSYVLRGSRVGGTVLAPIISGHLGLPEGIADNYFGDAAAGPAWVRFRRRLDIWGHGAGGAAREDVVRIARDVLDLIGDRVDAALPPAELPPAVAVEGSGR